MGAGKTSVLGESPDLLALRRISHAAIDVDALGLAHLPSASANNGVMYRNLRSVCENYASLGVERFLLVRVLGRSCRTRPLQKHCFHDEHGCLPHNRKP